MVDTNDCWLYAGSIDSLGYGKIHSTLNGKTKGYRAHRVTYETLIGPIPEGLVIDHLCRVRSCINPSHLEPVTARVNTLRGEGVLVNKRKTRCPKGHPYTVENTAYNTMGWRLCRECEKNRHKTYYKAHSEKWKAYNAK